MSDNKNSSANPTGGTATSSGSGMYPDGESKSIRDAYDKKGSK